MCFCDVFRQAELRVHRLSKSVGDSNAVTLGMHKNRFAIISQPRSGSTLIRKALNGHHQVCCQGVLFALTAVTGYELGQFAESGLALREKVRRVRDSESYDTFMECHVYPEDNEIGAIGFKNIDRHFALEKIGSFLFDFLDEHRDIKLIFLHRQDQLAQFVSHGIKTGRLDPNEKGFLPPQDFEDHLKTARSLKEQIWSAFPQHSQCHLSFEHLMQDPECAIYYLCGFLGVDFAPLVIDRRPSSIAEQADFLANLPRLRQIWADARPGLAGLFKPEIPEGLRVARKFSWSARASYWAGRLNI